MQKKKKIWIDLDNSPHIPLFNPIIKELKLKNYDVIVTVRDYAQAIGLANYFELDYRPLGKHFGKNKVLKAIGLVIRSLQMLPIAIKEKPDLALSHGSRSQFLFASLYGLKSAVASDYEHSAYFPFIVPTLGIFPEVIPESFTSKYFKRIAKYPGIKEDVYKQNLKPDASIVDYLGLTEDQIVISIRPPATRAHYHTQLSDELFNKTMNYILADPRTKLVILPRTQDQKEDIQEKYKAEIAAKKIVIPGKILDGLNLIWFSDLVISGGGTMIREAAALRVPSYSIFGGTIGAVDKYLEDEGRLFLIRTEQDIYDKIKLGKKDKSNGVLTEKSAALEKIVEEVVNLVESN